jgi:hypothetical protein
MSNINNLTLENLKWIKEVSIPASQLRITDDTLAKVMRGRAMILGYPFQPVGCFSCSARSEFKVSQSVLEQYQPNILARISELESEVATIGEEIIIDENNTQESNEFNEVLAVKPTSSKKTKKIQTIKESWEDKDEE